MTTDEYLEIRRLHDEGLSNRAIARRLGIHRRKVVEALGSPHVPKRNSPRRGSIIDAHRGFLMGKLQLYPELSAARLHQMLRGNGFEGGYTLVKEAVAEIRPQLKPVYESLRFAPGECAQVDWGVWKTLPVDGGGRRLSFFTMVLCHSRMLYAEVFFGEALEYWLAAHRNAFEYFGGVTERVMVDNCKTAVITPACGGREAQLNETYEAFARHYGFTVVPCTPGRPNEKGRVEKAVAYIKSAFLAGREPTAPEALNPALRHWLEHTANVRKHRTTLARPIDLFAQEDKPALKALPPSPHCCAALVNCVANSTCRVTVDTNRYSVAPTFASQRLLVKRFADRVTITTPDGQHTAADHPRCFGRGREIVDSEHAEALSHLKGRAHQNRQISAFLALSSVATQYLAQLKDKRIDYLQHVRRINAQCDIFGREAVARAVADTHEHGAYAAEYVLNLLNARKRFEDLEDLPLHVMRNADLLDIEPEQPDLDVYDRNEQEPPRTEEQS